jgi:hypothetical protein
MDVVLTSTLLNRQYNAAPTYFKRTVKDREGSRDLGERPSARLPMRYRTSRIVSVLMGASRHFFLDAPFTLSRANKRLAFNSRM